MPLYERESIMNHELTIIKIDDSEQQNQVFSNSKADLVYMAEILLSNDAAWYCYVDGEIITL